METQGRGWARWRERRSTPMKRALWILVFFGGFVLAWVVLPEWTERNRPLDVENFRPAYFVVLSALYWTIPVLLWPLLYPGDGHPVRSPRPPREDAAQPQA